MNCRQTAPSA